MNAALLFLVAVHPAARAQQPAPHRTLAITSVTVVDVSAANTPAALRPNQTVVIAEGKIAAVGSSANTPIPNDAQRIDGASKFLIPGLWDMHAHVLGPEKRTSFLPLYVAAGVTSIRDMNTALPMAEVREWRRQIDEGNLLGPRVIAVAGSLIGGPGARFGGELRAANEADARRIVIARKEEGVDFIKVGSNIPGPAFRALADETRRQGLLLVGHVPGSSIIEALEAGQQGVEHAGRLLLASSPLEEEILEQRLGIQQTQVPFMLEGMRLGIRARKTYSEARLKSVSDAFRAKGAVLVPTLVQGFSFGYLQNGAMPNSEWLKYMPKTFTRAWRKGHPGFGQPTDEDFAEAQANFDKTVELVGVMHRAGVNILAGTDANGGLIALIPGISLHQELVLLVQAGMTPLEALRAATLAPAKFLKVDHNTGTIERGKRADLVLLDADPLRDIHHTQKIAAVILHGRLHNRAALDGVLANLAAQD